MSDAIMPIPFEDLVETARSARLTEPLALRLLEDSRGPVNAQKLFQAASALRDAALGGRLWMSAGVSAVLPCEITPRCAYCTFFTTRSFPIEELLAAVGALDKLGFRHIHLSGGTRLDGYDAEILGMVEAIRAVSPMDVEINLGPSFSLPTIRALKGLGVRSVTSSLETFNPAVFARAKPGDSLARRKQLLEECEAEGMSIRSMVLLGLGESEADRIAHLFYLKQFSRLRHLRFSRLFPYPGTGYARHPRCSPWEVARLVAVARLLMPRVDLGLAAGNGADDLPLWYQAGGGNQLLGAAVSLRESKAKAQPGEEIIPVTRRVAVVSRIELLRNYVHGMGREIGFETPSADAVGR